MIILGIDPGTNILGYGIIVADKQNFSVLDFGSKKITKSDSPAEKLSEIYYLVSELIKLYRPDELAIESPFYGKNIQSMLKLGRAQGVAMAAAFEAGLTVEEYSPKRIKLAITGCGTSSKEQVSGMLQHILKIKLDLKELDASDALACAVCHANSRKSFDSHGKKYNSWNQFITDNPDRKI